MKRFRTLFAGLLLLGAAWAAAQFMPGMQLPSLWYNPALVMDPAVQKDLNLSQKQVQVISGVLMQEGMKMLPLLGSSMGGKTPNQNDFAKAMPKIMEAYGKMQKACTDNLNPAQRDRLHQLTLQSYGPKALLDPKVGSQIGLTQDQKTKLALAMQKSTASQRDAAMKMMQGGMKDPAQIKQIMAKGRAQSDALLTSILTPSQRAKWKALQGRPLQMSGLGAMMGG